MSKTLELKLAKIGNSRGIRLPADWIRRHSLETGVVIEERGNELVLRPKSTKGKLSWAETAHEIAAANEDWSEWDGTSADGLDSTPWKPAPPARKRTATGKTPTKPAKKP